MTCSSDEKRVFLGWQEPFPRLAVRRLFEYAEKSFPVDFGAYRILVPTAGAGRLLREFLAEYSTEYGGIINLEIQMPDQLLAAPDAASPAQVLSAWRKILQNPDDENAAALLGPAGPRTRKHPEQLLAVAATLQECRCNLAEDALSAADAAQILRSAGQTEAANRFCCIARLEQQLLALCPGDPAAQMLKKWQEPQDADTRMILVLHCPELRGAAARYLERHPHVEYWIHAPPDCAGLFDRQGRALPDWLEQPFAGNIREQLRIAPRPEDQVDALEKILQTPGFRVRAVCVQDQETAEAWQDRLRRLPVPGKNVFFPAVKKLSECPWTRLYTAILALNTEDPAKDVIAAILHHGFLADSTVLTEFDRIQQQYLVQSLHGFARLPADAVLSPAIARLRHWHEQLRKSGSGILSKCWNILMETGTGLAEKSFSPQNARAELAALEKLITQTEEAEPENGEFAAALFRELLASARLRPEPAGDEALDAVGFLEIPWYGDQTVILAGMSENAMGYGCLTDAFLPEQAKERLNMRTVRKSRAADAFRMAALLHSAQVRILQSKFSVSGEVLTPLSMLLQCPAKELPERVLLLFGSDLVLPEKASVLPQQQPLIPRRQKTLCRKLSVTDFSSYLSCPFSFYLQKIRHVQEMSDRAIELDALQSGTLLHAVLAACTGVMQSGADAGTIYEQAETSLRMQLKKYGSPLPGLLTLQSSIMQENLRYFAEAQEIWAQKGWQVIRSEEHPESTAISGFSWAEFYHRVFPQAERQSWRESVEFKGRFDRLDARELENGSRELCVIDYKTGGEASSPETRHFGSGSGLTASELFYRAVPGRKDYWRDLQLPLYVLMIRHLLQEEPAERIRAAYFSLPLAYTSTGVCEFDALSDTELLHSAMQCADEVARRIFGPEPVFWPPRRYDRLFTGYPLLKTEDFDGSAFYCGEDAT